MWMSYNSFKPSFWRCTCMSGGFSFNLSQFNRSTQAKRQPGSAFKPFVYITALNEGFNPSTLVLDAPYVIDQGPDCQSGSQQLYWGVLWIDYD